MRRAPTPSCWPRGPRLGSLMGPWLRSLSSRSPPSVPRCPDFFLVSPARRTSDEFGAFCQAPAEGSRCGKRARLSLRTVLWGPWALTPPHLAFCGSLQVGTVWINGQNFFDAAAGVGGTKESGNGRDGGKEVCGAEPGSGGYQAGGPAGLTCPFLPPPRACTSMSGRAGRAGPGLAPRSWTTKLLLPPMGLTLPLFLGTVG